MSGQSIQTQSHKCQGSGVHTPGSFASGFPFLQAAEKPGYLRNDQNDFLNYTDDWYILGWKPDAYAVIYYRGNNDAWQGYGGLTVYTR